MSKYFEPNKKYFTMSIYAVVVILIGAVICKALISLSSTIAIIKGFLTSIAPFLIGLLIAYFINPLVKWFDVTFFRKLLKNKHNSISKILSIIISYIIVFGLIITALIYIIPSMIKSMSDLVDTSQTIYSNLLIAIDDMSKKYPDLDLEYIQNSISSAFPSAIDILSTAVQNIGPMIYGTSVSVISWVCKIFIGIIVSFYMLLDKKIMLKGVKKFIYATLDKPKAESLIATLRESNAIFSGFIIGKLIDSLIIGVLCFIFTSLLKLPYAMIISIVVGITNMIPYFGPFIGAVPGALLLLMISPGACIKFIILIFVLQQFDGLILGPKILGNSTGLRPFWIIFAITVGGWVGGVLGMFLGVPFVAVIANLVDKFINKQLEKKNISI